MLKRTFIDKCTTIFWDSEDNYGLYPVGMMCYGKNISRSLIHFDILEIKELIDSNTFPYKDKLKHVLKLTNCGSVDSKKNYYRNIVVKNSDDSKRATSFDIIAFKVPKRWDRGIGFDSSLDFWTTGKSAVSEDGCNWFQACNGSEWDEEGIYSQSFLSREYTLWQQGKNSVVVGRQHFDYGNENFEIDITDYVNKLLTDAEEYGSRFAYIGQEKEHEYSYLEDNNFGLCLCFSPLLESSDQDVTNYVGFFTDTTNTIFYPVLETRYEEGCIKDDRNQFYLGKKNRVYFYSNIGGEMMNLDNNPVCTIRNCNDDVVFSGTSVMQKCGVYYVDVNIQTSGNTGECLLYDTWSNISFSGNTFNDVEMKIEIQKNDDFFKFGGLGKEKKGRDICIFGIKDSEKLNQGELRRIDTIFKEKYSHEDYDLFDKAKYRLYVLDGNSEIDVIEWDCIEKAADRNFFYIDTASLAPSEYHIDVMLNNGDEVNLFKDCLKFKVVSNKTGMKK